MKIAVGRTHEQRIGREISVFSRFVSAATVKIITLWTEHIIKLEHRRRVRRKLSAVDHTLIYHPHDNIVDQSCKSFCENA